MRFYQHVPEEALVPFTDKDLNMGYDADELAQLQRVFVELLPLVAADQRPILKSAIINEAGNSDDLHDLQARVRRRLKLQSR